MSKTPKLHPSWLKVLGDEFQKDYFKTIKQRLVEDISSGKVLYPPMPMLFHALDTTPLDAVNVVILGQDPYHGAGQAHGLCFSVQDGVAFPPSLQNIFKEIKSDIGGDIPKTGNLDRWANQGILLLNSILSVREGEPASHAKIGWEYFTDKIIQTVSEQREGVVFLLWGNFAKSKKAFINWKKHHILEASHPSPLGAFKGFFGCKHFSKTNELLKKMGKKEIEW